MKAKRQERAHRAWETGVGEMRGRRAGKELLSISMTSVFFRKQEKLQAFIDVRPQSDLLLKGHTGFGVGSTLLGTET